MKKIMIFTVCSIMMTFCLSGCKSNEPQTFTYEADGVTGIDIETGANSVSITRNTGSNIEVSYSHDVAVIEDGILKINIPMPGAGVNLKNPTEITVSVPDIVFDFIRIKSEVGNVNIESVNTDKLTIDMQYGDITLSGMEGHITAKSEMGSIQTDLPIASEITNIGKAGQEMDGYIGTSENEINLYTNVGTITFTYQ